MTAFNIPVNFLKNPKLTPIEKLILGRINAFAPEPCYMKTSDFCEELGISHSATSISLTKLKKKNLITTAKYGGLVTVQCEE